MKQNYFYQWHEGRKAHGPRAEPMVNEMQRRRGEQHTKRFVWSDAL